MSAGIFDGIFREGEKLKKIICVDGKTMRGNKRNGSKSCHIVSTWSREEASFWETKKYEKYGIPSLFMCDGPHGLRKQERENGADMLGGERIPSGNLLPCGGDRRRKLGL